MASNRGAIALRAEIDALHKRIAELEASEANHRDMEEALRESEERYRSLVRKSSDGVFIFDPKTKKILEANTQLLKMLGYKERDFLSLTYDDIVVIDKATLDANLKKVLRCGYRLTGLRQYRCKDGSLINVDITSTLVRYSKSKVCIVNVRSTADREKADQALQKQAAILRDQAELLEIAEDAITVLDMTDRIIFWNHGAENRYGWSKEEALGTVAYKLLRTKFPKPVDEMKKELFAKGKIENEIVHTRRDGTRIMVASRWVVRRDKQGNPVAILEINNDITERKRAEEALQRAKDELERRVAERTAELQETNERLTLELARKKRVEEALRKAAERYKNLFENSPIGIYRASPKGRILMANPTLLRMLGYSSFNELTAAKRKNADYEPTYLKKKMRKLLERDGRVRAFEATWKRPDKSTISIRENARAIYGADNSLLYYEGTVEDISEQKTAEERIQQYQKQLRSLASELSLAEERERRRIATILHDHIGQILAFSKIQLGSLLESAPSSEHYEHLREIREYMEQAIKYTRSLTFELSPPVLYELGLEAALEWLGEQIETQHGVRCEFESDVQPKPVDDEIRVFLFTAVRELLVNVAKHAGAERTKITVRRMGDDMSIHVADNGIGFNVTKMMSHGSESRGFGLFSIRERLRHLGGQTDIRSGRGRGTRVMLVVPLKVEKKEVRRNDR